MNVLLAPLDVQIAKKPVRLPSLFVQSGASSPVDRSPRTLGMSDVLNAELPASPSFAIARLPSISSIMRRDASPVSSPKCEMHEQTMSPVHKQSCMDIYKQLQTPASPVRARCSEHALKNLLAGAALSQLASMQTDDENSETHNADKNKRASAAKLCGMEGCKKRAKAGGYCIAHGGGLRCSEEGCQKHAVSLGLCISHGGGKRCTVEGCLNASRKNGVCWSHGGKRLCKLEGCNKGPKSGGYCWSHGGKMKK
ncbi:hypothetical protein ATCC90586_008777 [Pythium insidiosum]|nr:hypothetical protein ATCC90586_008777 [Pythium insidiosum]